MSLPPDASRLPVTLVTLGLRAWDRTRGAREFAMRRGSELVQIAAHTPLGRLLPPPSTPDGSQAEVEAERIVAEARQAAMATITQVAPAMPDPKEVPEKAAAKAEQVTRQLEVEPPQDRDELPIPDFDNVTLGSLRARLRSLSLEQLATLREWEQAHAHRLPVMTLLDNRITKLAADGPAYPADPQHGQ
jgi:hypothetical protein